MVVVGGEMRRREGGREREKGGGVGGRRTVFAQELGGTIDRNGDSLNELRLRQGFKGLPKDQSTLPLPSNKALEG